MENSKGLKSLIRRSADGTVRKYNCENCGCVRFNPCTCATPSGVARRGRNKRGNSK